MTRCTATHSVHGWRCDRWVFPGDPPHPVHTYGMATWTDPTALTRLTFHEAAHHRNGVSGNSFAVVTFTEHDADGDREMVGIVFGGTGADPDAPLDDRDVGTVAVFDRKLLGEGVIAFGTNSWRGDRYAPELRRYLATQWPWKRSEPHVVGTDPPTAENDPAGRFRRTE